MPTRFQSRRLEPDRQIIHAIQSRRSMKHESSSLPRAVFVVAFVLVLLLVAGIPAPSSAASVGTGQKKDKNKDSDGKGKKHKKAKKTKGPSNAPDKIGTPILWEDPGPISELDLVLGIGSEEGKPKPPFQFKEEDTSGT